MSDDEAETPVMNSSELDKFLLPLVVNEETLHQLAYRFSITYQDLALNSKDQFLPTPVSKLPTGEETGLFLAIDVGGSNLRVGFVELLGEEKSSGTASSRDAIDKAQRQRVRRILERSWPIGEHLKKDKAEDLFAWIGDCIAEVVAESLSSSAVNFERQPKELDMGITFSFPMM